MIHSVAQSVSEKIRNSRSQHRVPSRIHPTPKEDQNRAQSLVKECGSCVGNRMESGKGGSEAERLLSLTLTSRYNCDCG